MNEFLEVVGHVEVVVVIIHVVIDVSIVVVEEFLVIGVDADVIEVLVTVTLAPSKVLASTKVPPTPAVMGVRVEVTPL